jgi:multiple sugar transport system permease protein
MSVATLRLSQAMLYLVLTVVALIILLPYIWMVSSSLKPESDIFSAQVHLLPSAVKWQNYLSAVQDYPLLTWLSNSVLIAVVGTVSVVVTAVLAGYSFGRLTFFGRDTIFFAFLGTMMIPIQVTIIPTFVLVRLLGWVNTYQGLIAPQLVAMFGVFLMRLFFLSFPSELEDAARIDGCGYLATLWRIVLPATRPALASLAIFAFTGNWNNFLWPLVAANDSSLFTIQVGLAAMKSDVIPWGPMMAATTISALPILIVYLFFQRQFVQGIVLSGLKG